MTTSSTDVWRSDDHGPSRPGTGWQQEGANHGRPMATLRRLRDCLVTSAGRGLLGHPDQLRRRINRRDHRQGPVSTTRLLRCPPRPANGSPRCNCDPPPAPRRYIGTTTSSRAPARSNYRWPPPGAHRRQGPRRSGAAEATVQVVASHLMRHVTLHGFRVVMAWRRRQFIHGGLAGQSHRAAEDPRSLTTSRRVRRSLARRMLTAPTDLSATTGSYSDGTGHQRQVLQRRHRSAQDRDHSPAPTRITFTTAVPGTFNSSAVGWPRNNRRDRPQSRRAERGGGQCGDHRHNRRARRAGWALRRPRSTYHRVEPTLVAQGSHESTPRARPKRPRRPAAPAAIHGAARSS
jgi:hypothetical protein